MELSKRMKNNACLVDQGSMAADIGCDHGYVSIFLVQERKCKKVIAMDIGAEKYRGGRPAGQNTMPFK